MKTYSWVLSAFRRLSLSSLNACAIGIFLLILGVPGLSVTPGAAVIRYFEHIQAPSDLGNSAALVDANSWVRFWIPPTESRTQLTATVRIQSGMPVQSLTRAEWASPRTYLSNAEVRQLHLVEFEVDVPLERVPGVLPRWRVVDGLSPLELVIAREQAYQAQAEFKGVRFVQDLGVYEPKSVYSVGRKLGVYIGYFGPLLADVLSVLLVGYGLYALVYHRRVRTPVIALLIGLAILGQAQPALVRVLTPKAFVLQLDAPFKDANPSPAKKREQEAPAKRA